MKRPCGCCSRATGRRLTPARRPGRRTCVITPVAWPSRDGVTARDAEKSGTLRSAGADHHAGDATLRQGLACRLGGLLGHAGEARAIPAVRRLHVALGARELGAESAADVVQPVAGDGLLAEGADLD